MAWAVQPSKTSRQIPSSGFLSSDDLYMVNSITFYAKQGCLKTVPAQSMASARRPCGI